ncbi:MAG TPA: class I SAM-dependent methyltransferase [Thermomicrobiales bacterium]|nr:class I SAM-dependent methyltransferase [Thermomicrobiales bacterium]
MRHAGRADWKATTARQFDAVAPRWRERGLPDGDRLASVLADLACPPGGLLLDAGCGTGNWSAALALAGYCVRGIDLSPAMIAEAGAVAREHRLDPAHANFGVGDVEHLPFPDDTFDGALCFNALDFTPRPGAAVAELRRVVRPSGRLVLACLGARSPVKRERWRRFLPDNDEIHTGNDILPWELEALLGALGWELVDQRPLFGGDNHYEAIAADLPDTVLRQTVAGSWRFVARKPPGGDA